MQNGPLEWKRAAGLSYELLAEKLAVNKRCLIRYFLRERAWPYDAALRLKALAAGALTDESFVFGSTSRKSSHARRVHARTVTVKGLNGRSAEGKVRR